MTFSRSARGAVFAVFATLNARPVMPAVSLAQAPAARDRRAAAGGHDAGLLGARGTLRSGRGERGSRGAAPGQGGRGGPDADDPLNDFFRRFGIPNQGGGGGGQPRNAPPAHGTGSGFIVSPDGYILTNAHVVASAETVTVKLTDRREFQAKVVGQDERTDVAVIKIDAQNLPVVKIGDPRQLQARTVGGGHRFALQLRQHRDRGHRQRHGPLAAQRQLRAVHPDRRGRESGQLRRPAVQHARRSGRHQLADLQPDRQLHGPVVRHSDRHRRERREPDHQDRPRRARPHRRHHPGCECGVRRVLRSRPPARRAGEHWSSRPARPRRPASSPGT